MNIFNHHSTTQSLTDLAFKHIHFYSSLNFKSPRKFRYSTKLMQYNSYENMKTSRPIPLSHIHLFGKCWYDQKYLRPMTLILFLFLAVHNSSLYDLVTDSLIQSLTDFYFWHYRVTLETCDLWDIWSEWWGNMTCPTFLQFWTFGWKFWQFWQFSEET